MKKHFIKIFILTLFASIIFITPVLAFNLDVGGLAQGILAKAGYDKDVNSLSFAIKIGGIISMAMGLLGMIFLVLVFYAGYLWLTAQGEEENIKKAQKIIYGAIIGLVVLGSAYSIVNLILPMILEKTTGGSGAGGTTGGVTAPCCQKCATGMQTGKGACSLITVDSRMMCQNNCSAGGSFYCYYSEVPLDKCVP